MRSSGEQPQEPKKIKGSMWDPSEYRTGTKAILVAKHFDTDEDDDIIQIGCNTIPIALVKMAGGAVKKGRASVPVVLTSSKRLVIEGGEMFRMSGWYREQINEYAHRVIITKAVKSEPNKAERYVIPGLYACSAWRHVHSWMITASGQFVSVEFGSVYEEPEPNCHPLLNSRLRRFTGAEQEYAPVKVSMFEGALCCVQDAAHLLPEGHPDHPATWNPVTMRARGFALPDGLRFA